MKLKQLIEHLQRIADRHGSDAEVDVLTEIANLQVQLPCNDVAYSKGEHKVIVMHEREPD